MTHQPKLHHSPANGLSLASFEWRAALRGATPTLWMVHATGFHGRVWDQVIHHLPGRHVIAVEQRGHGRSEARDFGRCILKHSATLGVPLRSRGAHLTMGGRWHPRRNWGGQEKSNQREPIRNSPTQPKEPETA